MFNRKPERELTAKEIEIAEAAETLTKDGVSASQVSDALPASLEEAGSRILALESRILALESRMQALLNHLQISHL